MMSNLNHISNSDKEIIFKEDDIIAFEVEAESDLYQDLVEASKKRSVPFTMVHKGATCSGSASIVLGKYNLENSTVKVKASPIDRKWTIT